MSKRQPDAAQRQRISAFTELLRQKLPLQPGFAALQELRPGQLERSRSYREVDVAAWLANLNAGLGETSLEHWTDWYLFPLERGLDPEADKALSLIAEHLAACVIDDHPADEYTTEQLIGRCSHIVSHAGDDYEQVPRHWGGPRDPLKAVRAQPNKAWMKPSLEDCLARLVRRPASPRLLDFGEFFLAGSWDQRIPSDDEDEPGYRVAEHFGWLSGAVPTFALMLADAGRMDLDRLVQAQKVWGSQATLECAENGLAELDDEEDQTTLPAAKARLAELSADRLLALLTDWPQSTVEIEHAYGDPDAYHERWLIEGLRLIERAGLAPGQLKDGYDNPEFSPVISLLNLRRLSDRPSAEIIDQLGQFSQQTLLTALPFAGMARNLILKVLGWDDLIPLQGQLYAIAGTSASTTDTDFSDVPNCESVTVGVLDRPALDLAMEQAKPKHLVAYLKALWAVKSRMKNTRMVFEAYQGKNRAALEKKLVRHGQVAIRAYGALPIDGPDDARQRYSAFMRMHKEVTQYGPERQANSQAAVKAGLSNLAQAAGFADATRLEWAMEAEIAESAGAMQYELGDYQVALVLDGLNASIQASKKGKVLKSIPAAVRKFAEYAELKQMQAQMKDQVRRFRKALEAMMCSGEVLPVADLQRLVRMPAMRLLLDQLLLQSSDGNIGWFSAEAMSLTDLEGNRHLIEEGARIAHPLHLFEADQLSPWQRQIVEQRRVQPFKQAFRELYLLTPAERETATYSNRFHGQVVKSAVTSRLLQSRSWSVNNGEYEPVSKYDRELKIDAQMDFPDIGHFLAENETVTIDTICFRQRREKMPLDQVPPLLFSEIMRDADLVASVAQASEEYISSAESMQRRAELVTALMRNIGLDRVRCEGHFAHIQGHLANYRVHLGSATIHIEPGNYLCVVPARDEDEKVYLPFADVDRKMSEVISKIFLLLDDQSITDKSILAQIRRSQ
ncbi:MAG: DUF4132 domain-containing protein [Xanthomonadales bacterium]|nr:DUF4132 domain-containing protein [Xanthomonadales bacterium]